MYLLDLTISQKPHFFCKKWSFWLAMGLISEDRFVACDSRVGLFSSKVNQMYCGNFVYLKETFKSTK